MKYIFLLYSDEAKHPEPGTPEFGEVMAAYMAFNERVVADGVMVAGEPLEGVATATTLRMNGSDHVLTDGPYVETKEQLGGFYILDCKDLDEATKYAALIPCAEYGPIEIRPLMGLPEDGC